jgi:hypothetical protein
VRGLLQDLRCGAGRSPNKLQFSCSGSGSREWLGFPYRALMSSSSGLPSALHGTGPTATPIKLKKRLADMERAHTSTDSQPEPSIILLIAVI